MPRTARIVVTDVPYHITQRGNRRQDVFFCDEDRRAYLSWLEHYSQRYDLDILSYCLMTNHVHLVSIPRRLDSIANTLRIVDIRHCQMINSRLGWSGHLWQGRYFSTALDEPHLWAAVRYVERNPVRAGMVKRAEDYPWSSAASHLGKRPDKLIRSNTEWGGIVEDWQEALAEPEDDETMQMIRTRTHCGFPCGDEHFVSKLSEAVGRSLVLRPRGRPRR
ncbi:MAG: transposase [Armatimonadota bacterium]|nr:transposase [Armatimonadota bacterium]